MAQRPINERNPLASREAIWKAIRYLKIFTVRDLWQETRGDSKTIHDYVTGLQNAGYLAIQREGITGKIRTEYVLVRDNGIEPPRVRKDGSEITSGRGRERMWMAIRILKEFSVNEIIATASTSVGAIALGEAKNFIGHLFRAGYLVVVCKSRPGVMARYRLLTSKNTGPKPPVVQRDKSVFDQNLHQVVWSQNRVFDRAEVNHEKD